MYILQINLFSFSNNILNNFLNQLNKNFKFKIKKNNKNNQILTLLKSPHVHKKSRIQYQFKNFKYTIFYSTNNFLNILFFIKIFQRLKNFNIIFTLKIIKNNEI